MKKIVSIIDYGMGNIFSLCKMLDKLSVTPIITNDPERIVTADYVVLPGVGSFAKAMMEIEKKYLAQSIRERVLVGKPILGICLGMQLLCQASEEGFSDLGGLAIMPGKIRKFPKIVKYPIPQTQWNKVSSQGNSKLLGNNKENQFFYFLHSYYRALDECGIDETIITAKYCDIDFCAGFERDAIFGTQFHPELSGINGQNLLKRFLSQE